MSLLEKAITFMGEEDDRWDTSLWSILGPLFVLIAFSLDPRNLLIFGVGVFGLLITTRWQIRGFFYALILLSVTAIIEHLFLIEHHLWQLGLEGTYALAFFITALSIQQRMHFVQSLSKHIDAREASIRNLEEERTKNGEITTTQLIAQQEKIADLQKQFEEGQTEYSSLLILNEVLRKTAAVHIEEKQHLQQILLEAQLKTSLLKNEEQNIRINQELQEQYQLALQRLEVIQTERNSFKERLEKVSLQEQNFSEETTHLQERITQLVKFESLYKQLKLQFEEKNELLRQTRSELFKTDTELQTLRMEKEQKELQTNPLNDEMQEISSLTEELSFLEKENRELQSLVTTLVSQPIDEISIRPKKSKRKLDQTLLF